MELTLDEEKFFELKRKEIYNQHMRCVDFTSLSEEEKQTAIQLIEDAIDAELQLDENSYPPMVWFRLSSNDVFDEYFIELSEAISKALEAVARNGV